jgi:gas vesicle protein
MKTKILKSVALATLVTTSFAFAQNAPLGGPQGDNRLPPPPPPQGNGERPGGEDREGGRGFFGKFFNQEKNEFREDMKEARGEFRDDMKEKRDFMMSSSTPGTATPTPWKNFRDNVKDARKDFKDDMKEMRDEFRERMPRPPQMSATATAQIAAKLGITTEVLTAQLASGTKLKELIKDKITREEMKQILPPMRATFTKMVEERGFFNNLRSRIFGAKQEVVERTTDEFGETTENPTGEQPPRPFWQRFFGF